ncbi:hypothetical protein, partial [Enterococcus faecium]
RFLSYVESLRGENGPLGSIALLAELVWWASPENTDCGRSVPVLSRDGFQRRPIDPSKFPPASPVAEYWDRLPFLPMPGYAAGSA